MNTMIATAFLLAIGTTACAATLVVESDEHEGAGGASNQAHQEKDSHPKAGACFPCVGATCGLCRQSPRHVAYVCYEGMPPAGSGTCFDTGDLLSDDQGDFYTCSLCSN